MNPTDPATADASTYSAVLTLRDGRKAKIRALRPTDREDFVVAVRHTSDRTLYRRFFTPRRRFTDTEVASFVNVDFVNHVALVAVMEEGACPESWAPGATSSPNPVAPRSLSPSWTTIRDRGSALHWFIISLRLPAVPG